MHAVKLLIQGKVQGVGYRRWFEQQAIALDLKGYVKNLATGDVEALVIGSEDAIHKILKHSQIGPLRANVTQIDQHIIPMHDLDYDDFKMMR
ncbi:acylphosphatase [Acinetobacter sp. ANC 5054]|uniref:acylphosphatase n=1 Tax=Acinetobacter sp. ANC 5054 TaxID=1977877 RepID=UPI000A354664|nr:acylphosphatase [Acinetobacter sp. ANC 5054]OTG82032.1 acylphosphatase [Acinetobacter sp. ANC 5054]